MSDTNKMDSYFRDRLAGFEQSPPESSWESIAHRLGKKKKKSVIILVLRIAAGMAILFSTGLGVYMITKAKTNIPQISLSENDKTANTSENEQSIDKSYLRDKIHTTGKNQAKSTTDANNNSRRQPSLPAETKTTYKNKTDYNQGVGTQTEQHIQTLIAETGKNNNPDILPLLIGIKGHPEISPKGALPERELTAEEAASLLLADYYDISESKTPSANHWSLGSEVAPLYSYRAITSSDFDQSTIKQFNESESGILAYAGGIRVNYSTGKRLSIQSGIYYSRYGQQKEGNSLSDKTSQNYGFVQVTNSTGRIKGFTDSKISYRFAQPSSSNLVEGVTGNDMQNGITTAKVNPLVPGDAGNVSFEQLFDYFEVPLIMKYKIIDRKFDFSLNGGLVTNLLFGNSINMINDGRTTRITETEEINKINYLGSLGLGFDYTVSDHFDITMEPRFRYYINPIGTNSDIIVHPFSFGFFAGFNYRF